MHSSLRIWGQDHSYAETEESGEGRRQTTAQSCVTESWVIYPRPLEPVPPSTSLTWGTHSPHSPLPQGQGTAEKSSDGPSEAPHTWYSHSSRPSAWHQWCNAGTHVHPPVSRSGCAGQSLQKREGSAPTRAATDVGPPSLRWGRDSGVGAPSTQTRCQTHASHGGNPMQPMKSPAPSRLSESSQKSRLPRSAPISKVLPLHESPLSCMATGGEGSHPYS